MVNKKFAKTVQGL